ncbi:MAG: extracellular solute-binding protein, partial [Paenibacillus sp.]|nr:extracellular solute-binding protein [Paenibacillus sp.]
ERLSVMDSEGSKLLLNSPAYRKIWTTVAGGIQKGWLQQPLRTTETISGIDFYKRNSFMTGNAAMIIQYSSFANDLAEGRKRHNLSTFDWDIVTEPIHPSYKDEATFTTVDGVYAISATASSPEDGWELIKLINSASIAKKNAASIAGGGISTLNSVPIKPETARAEAFSILRPGTSSSVTMLPQPLAAEITPIVNEEIQSYIQGQQSLDEAIDAIQAKGQNSLDKVNLQSK